MTDMENKDARYALITKEIYLQMKKDQKAFYDGSMNTIRDEYVKSCIKWHSEKPNGLKQLSSALMTTWHNACPQRPFVLDIDARSINIVYSMIRGHKYRDIEKTYRRGNSPHKSVITNILTHYSINYDAFINACGAIDYE